MAASSSPAPPPTDQTLDAVVERLVGHQPESDVSVVRECYGVLERYRAEIDDPGPIQYAIDTAGVLADLRLDAPAVAAGLLARLVADQQLDVEQLRSDLGDDVTDLLDGVVRLATIRWDRIEEEEAESLRKMFLAMAQDIRVVMVVLAMRVQSMRALRYDDDTLDEEARRRFAEETLEVFAPLANRLGIWQLKWVLEDGAFRELEPEAYREITQLLADRREERLAFIDEVIGVLEDKLAEEGVPASIKGRPKHVYSIYQKMRRKELDFQQLYDISAVRVITERVQDCYAVLGLVHATWVPIPSEFDDYIAKPKDNGYQSLHTAVIGPRGRPFEVQIRTQEMHQLSEFGVAAHWAYKEKKSGSALAQDKFMLLRQLMDWEREVSDPHQFIESLKTDIFEDQVYVFTPGGDIIDLPVGATALDFAYRIHTMVGHRCRGARVNDQIVTLDTPLATGDRVEVLTHKKPQPSRDWMNPNLAYLKTASARSKVRQWYRKQGREEAVQNGRDLVERELSRMGLEHATLDDIVALLKYADAEELYATVGYGDRSSHSVSSAALSIERQNAPPDEPEIPSTPPPKVKNRRASGLRMDGTDGVLGRRARCCNPVPGDDVVGFVTRGRGIAIHLRKCSHIASTREPERLVDIGWGSDDGQDHAVDVEIRARDRAGLMGELSKLVSGMGVNISSARAEGNRQGSAWIRLGLDCRSAEQVAKVIGRIDRHPEVLEVRRVRGG